jgi:hypothetical protein
MAIDPEVGACQEDIFYHYKLALHRAYAEDATAWENDERVRKGKPIYTPEEYAERVDWFLRRIPYKLVKCRYHSFQRYFHWLKQLGWVEFAGKEERSTVQENMPDYPQAPPRRYYRLTKKGIAAPDYEWSRPQLVLYPERPLEYFREKRTSVFKESSDQKSPACQSHPGNCLFSALKMRPFALSNTIYVYVTVPQAPKLAL